MRKDVIKEDDVTYGRTVIANEAEHRESPPCRAIKLKPRSWIASSRWTMCKDVIFAARTANSRVMYAWRGHLWHGRHVWPPAVAGCSAETGQRPVSKPNPGSNRSKLYNVVRPPRISGQGASARRPRILATS
jgi:hypothetical protein